MSYPYHDDGRDLKLALIVMMRGGLGLDDQYFLRCAYRYYGYPIDRYINFGFRCCVSSGSRS